MADLKDWFDRVFVISLDRRPDRQESLQVRLGGPLWPFKAPEVFRAIDGKIVPHPPWWTNGKGAWGILRSNLQIIESCLNDPAINRILILEDDAQVVPGFPEKVAKFLDALPSDAEMIYLGGQHLKQEESPPVQVNEEVVRPFNVNRCHAYALTRSGMEKAYLHLTKKNWAEKHHIDHRYGVLHQSKSINVYAPVSWLVGQCEGKSDISIKHLPDRLWEPKRMTKLPPTIIAVLGSFRSGSSCVAGAMHSLGINMGKVWFQANKSACPKGSFEAKFLHKACMTCYPEPSFAAAVTYQKRVELLKSWGAGRPGPVCGAKNPKLCLMVAEMVEAWPGCKFIVIDRPIEESAKSLDMLGWWKPKVDAMALTKRLIEARDKALSDAPEGRVLRIQFHEFLADPKANLEKIAAFAKITPSKDQFDEAVSFVDPSLVHYRQEGESPTEVSL